MSPPNRRGLRGSKLFLLFACCFLLISSCGKKDNPDETIDNFDQKMLLQNVGEQIIVPGYEKLFDKATDLEQKITAFITVSDAIALAEAKNSFIEAYTAWQTVAMFEFGPAAQIALRNELNIYPTDTAEIEANINSGNYDLDALSSNDQKGFPAVDYLLFNDSDAIVIEQFTTAIDAEARKDYLSNVVLRIKAKAAAARDGWVKTEGDYIATFINNTGTDVGSSIGLLVNNLNQYYEVFLRDGKIGIPLGVRTLGIAVPEKTEAFYSGISLQLAVAAMQSVKNVFLGLDSLGNDGVGLDDYLISVGANNLVIDTKNQINEVISGLESLTDPLSETIVTDPSAVQAEYNELQKLVVYLKVDIPSRLGILISYQDNDGD